MAAKKTASAQRKTAHAKNTAAPKQRTAATPRSASRTAKAGEEIVTMDRRRAAVRAVETEEQAPAPQLERRAKVQRRRQIDPTTCERDYSIEEVEFMNAMDDYKRKNGRMFPTCSEILEVIRSLGYVQISAAGRAMLQSEGDLGLGTTPEEDFAGSSL